MSGETAIELTCVVVQVDLRQYINELMVNTGGCASSGFPIASCKIYPDKSYAFLEFRSVEEASNCMAFDGVAYKDSYLRVGFCCACHTLANACAVLQKWASKSLLSRYSWPHDLQTVQWPESHMEALSKSVRVYACPDGMSNPETVWCTS